MSVMLLTEHHFEFLNNKGGCTGTSESTLVKMAHCWKSRFAAHIRVLTTAESIAKIWQMKLILFTSWLLLLSVVKWWSLCC